MNSDESPTIRTKALEALSAVVIRVLKLQDIRSAGMPVQIDLVLSAEELAALPRGFMEPAYLWWSAVSSPGPLTVRRFSSNDSSPPCFGMKAPGLPCTWYASTCTNGVSIPWMLDGIGTQLRERIERLKRGRTHAEASERKGVLEEMGLLGSAEKRLAEKCIFAFRKSSALASGMSR